MEAISIGSDPHLYFQVGKIKISEGMKCLQDLVQWYKDNLIPESAGRVNEIMAYLQSLQRQVVQEIESLAQQGEVSVSSNVDGTNLQCRQEIIQISEENAYFGPTLNQEIEIVMNPNIDNTSSAKRRKLKSKVWEDFKKYEGINGKEWAKCKHCKKDFVGSSKSGTTHLRNHLKSCPGIKNLGGGVEKAKEKSVIDPELNGSDLVLKIIKYGFVEHGNNSNLVLLIAIILDPRYKMDYLKQIYKAIYGSQGDAHLKKIIDDFTNIYTKCVEGTNNSKSSSSLDNGDSNSLSTPSKKLDTMERSFAFSQHVNDIATPESEFGRYLRDSDGPRVGEDCDLLEWWHLNSPTYPTLAKIARDFLPSPIYTPPLVKLRISMVAVSNWFWHI
ncbi:zinc finger BED domain-containing protein RICESLEEPER 1-like [Pistacia vera]|uniref:zinc finger BED domain-containing protein RICESLEEPER 1-like n=1 Tax=Pistacia vera TaxID=55513 RepID=UPI001263D04A|nr:zinc finger BED domain-containing protein RICESLEEPER 1-like [Pistacia vera]